MGTRHLIHASGDREQDVRRWEHLAWQRYLRMSQTLADTPLSRAYRIRPRVEAAREDFAAAWAALGDLQ